jgi:PAS domain-containing protein
VFRRRELPRGDAEPVVFPLGARDGSLQRAMGAAEGWSGGATPGRTSPQESIRALVRIALDELGVAPKPKKRGARRITGAALANPALDGALTRILALTDELESFRREAQVNYEELQSTNEELKSTNEELVTSREETQSMNEELLSLNAELHGKNEALVGINDDMRNLLNSSQIPTLFLDNQLRLKRFTTQATRIANVIPTDLGRPITDITLTLRDDTLARDVRRVLDTLVALESRVRTRDGASFTMRIHPYRTAQDLIDGVVVSFVEITSLLQEAETLARARRREAIVALVEAWPGIAYASDEESGECIAVSRATESALGYPREMLMHATRDFWRSLRPAADRAEVDDGALGVAHARQIRHAEGRYATFDETITVIGDVGPTGRVRFVQLAPARSIEPTREGP